MVIQKYSTSKRQTSQWLPFYKTFLSMKKKAGKYSPTTNNIIQHKQAQIYTDVRINMQGKKLL